MRVSAGLSKIFILDFFNRLMTLSLETRLRSEISGFLKNPSHSPELKSLYVTNVLEGVRRYICVIAVQREDFRIKDLLKFCTGMAMQSAEPFRYSESAALIQGAQYADEMLFEILNRRFDDWAERETINLNDGAWQQIVDASEKLKSLIVYTFMEYHPYLVLPGERLNLYAVRPKKPKDAIWN